MFKHLNKVKVPHKCSVSYFHHNRGSAGVMWLVSLSTIIYQTHPSNLVGYLNCKISHPSPLLCLWLHQRYCSFQPHQHSSIHLQAQKKGSLWYLLINFPKSFCKCLKVKVSLWKVKHFATESSTKWWNTVKKKRLYSHIRLKSLNFNHLQALTLKKRILYLKINWSLYHNSKFISILSENEAQSNRTTF